MKAFILSFILYLLISPSLAQHTMIDSLRQLITQKDSTIKAILPGKKDVEKHLSGLSGELKESSSNITRDGKKMLQDKLNVVKLFEHAPLIRFNKLSAEAKSNYYDTAYGDLNSNAVNAYNLDADISIANIPVYISADASNRGFNMDRNGLDKLYKFNFDPRQYIENIKTQVLKKVDPKVVAASTLNRINSIKEKYEKGLDQAIQNIQKEFEQEYKSKLQLPADLSNLSVNDLGTLKSKLIPEGEFQKQQEAIERLQELMKKDVRTHVDDSLYSVAMQGAKRIENLEKVYKTILSWKQKFSENPVVKNLEKNLPFTPGNFQSYLNNNNNLSKVIKDNCNLSSLQRFFYNVTKLDLGKNAVNEGQFSLTNLINTGINGEFKNEKADIGIIYGQNNSVNNWLRSGLTNVSTNEYSKVTGLKIGTGTSSPFSQTVSLNIFEFNNHLSAIDGYNPQSVYLPVADHKDAVFSSSTSFALDSKNRFDLDVSKSFGSFNNSSASTNGAGKSVANSLFSGAGESNYAFKIGYEAQIFNSNVNVNIKKVGLGYNNPGNYLLRRGETEVGIIFAKQLLKNKLNLKYNGSYKDQSFDVSNNYNYKTINNKIQLGYRFKKNTKISFLYQQSNYTSRLTGYGLSYGSNNRVQLDGTYKLRWKKKTIINNTSFGVQRYLLPVINGESYLNESIVFTHVSSIIINKNLLSLSIIGNKSNSDNYLFNTSLFNTEINYSYETGNSKIHLGNSVGFYSNYGWNKQLGINQQISMTVMEKLNLDVQFGYKKAIKIIRPELANQLYVSSGVHFNF